MPKDPAFLFYPKDWLEGTAELLPNEKGVYIDLLAHQHQKKDLPNDTLRLARMVGLGHDDFLKIWAILKDKFKEKNGRFVNTKLTGVTKDRADKGAKNTIIGTFASLLRKEKPEPKIYAILKKEFNVDDFLTESTEINIERLNKWFYERLKSIAIENKDVNAIKDINTTIDEAEKKIENSVNPNTYPELEKEILSSGIWIEQTAMEYKLTIPFVENKLREFLKDVKLRGDAEKGLKEVKKYFINWLKQQVKNGKSTESGSTAVITAGKKWKS